MYRKCSSYNAAINIRVFIPIFDIFMAYCGVNHTFRAPVVVYDSLLPASLAIALKSTHSCNAGCPTEHKTHTRGPLLHGVELSRDS